MPEENVETRLVREEPAPLWMTRRRVRKEDGRYLIFYDFAEGAERAPGGPRPENAR